MRSDNIWMMNVTKDPLEKRFEVQFLDQYDLLGFGDVDGDNPTHRVKGNKLYTKEVYVHKVCMQIGMIISVKEAGSLDPPVNRRVRKTRQPESPDALPAPVPIRRPVSLPRTIPALQYETSEFYSLATHTESDSHSDPTPRSSTSVKATLGTLDYAGTALSPRGNVSSKSRPSRRYVGKSFKRPVEPPGTSQWEVAFNVQFEEETENLTNIAAAALNDYSDSDKDSNDSLSIDLLFSDDGSVTRNVDGNKIIRTRQLMRPRTYRTMTFQNDEDDTDIIPPRSKKPVRVIPRRHTSISSCGSSASTTSTLASVKSTRPAQGTSPMLQQSVRSDIVLQHLEELESRRGSVAASGAGAGAGAGMEIVPGIGSGVGLGVGLGVGEEKTREESEGRPWRGLTPWDISLGRKPSVQRNKPPSEMPVDISRVGSSPTRGRYNLTGTSGIPQPATNNDSGNESSRSKSPSKSG